jgi:hypothetical protein
MLTDNLKDRPLPFGRLSPQGTEIMSFSLTIFSGMPIYVVKLDVAVLNVGQDI